jgi:hypothetical protein
MLRFGARDKDSRRPKRLAGDAERRQDLTF